MKVEGTVVSHYYSANPLPPFSAMSARYHKCWTCPPFHLTKAILDYAKRSTTRTLSCTMDRQWYRMLSPLPPPRSSSIATVHYPLRENSLRLGCFPNQRSFVSTPIRYHDENLFVIVDKDPNFVMPTYNPPIDRVVSPVVEKLFKDILQLQQPHDIAVIGHLLMHRLCVSNEQMMMILQARLMGASGMSSSESSASTGATAPVLVEEKKIFDLKLVAFDDKSKIKVIKEVRAITGLGLKEAKDLVDSVPKVLKKDVKKEEAEQLKDVLTKVGAVVEIV